MKILITNDDGIDAAGIRKLTEIAGRITDDIYVVAPSGQRSAISHGITVGKPLVVKKEKFPVSVKAAYSCSGTPADCVKVAVQAILDSRPDIVLSGINKGYNMGYDTIYSGTVAAAREAVYQGMNGIAVSVWEENYDIADRYLEEILRDVIVREKQKHEIWNINFPNCTLAQCKGVKETVAANYSYYKDTYRMKQIAEDAFEYMLEDIEYAKAGEDTDFCATEQGYISVEKLSCDVLMSK